MATTGKQGVKRKLDHKTVEFKFQALLEVEKGLKSKSQIARDLNISHSTLCTWVKNAESIKSGYENYGPKRKSMKTGRWDELETALLKWFSNARDQGAVVSGPIMMEKANEFAQKLEISDFDAKHGWLTRFKDRHGIAFKSVCGESKSVDDDSHEMSVWQSRLQTLLQEYEPDQIYNADETGIFFKMLPDKTLEYKNVSCHGGKRSKERLTALVAANMSGTDKLPLLVIGKSAKPRCFKNVKTLPTKYTSNSKAWMTSEIFARWLKELDCQLKRQKKKIVMIVDNCPAHPNLTKLENMKLVFLPPNTTSKTQPMDQGVINNLKVHYRKRVVLRHIQAIDTGSEFRLSVLDALNLLSEAWDCVTPMTISNCFRHAGFVKSVEAIATEADEDDELDDIPLARLALMGNSVVLNDYIEFNEEIPTSAGVSDDDIIADVIDSRTSQSTEPDDEDDADTTEARIPTSDEAMGFVRGLQYYLQSKDDTENDLAVLRRLSRRVLRDNVCDLSKLRQSTIVDFFTPEERDGC